jgi:hypothetical protein
MSKLTLGVAILSNGGLKQEKRSQKVCEKSLKLIFEFLKNHHGNTIYQNLIIIF